mmetsp:Transcript_16982/g.47017  ORF Transcript_16982/g.47017 Transcript_16982/m.47017 type:complete len:200 (-) Transcript_16982:1431-2030(-)
MVGLSIGVRRKPLPHWVNAFISICNACGAWIASFGGIVMASRFPNLAPMLAAMAFAYLAVQEFRDAVAEERKDRSNGNRRGTQPSSSTSSTSSSSAAAVTATAGSAKSELQQARMEDVLKLALPMTLNNLAGGVAGGAAGFSPSVTAGYALLASFLTMLVGHAVGMKMGHHLPCNPSYVSGMLISVLCIITSLDVLEFL